MKRILLISLVFFAFITRSEAQIKVGVKGGGNLSFLRYNPDVEFDNRPSFGFHLGAFGHFSFSDQFGVQAELLYTQLGARSEGVTDFGAQQEVTDNINYIALPVMLKYSSPSGFIAEIGPSINFLVSAEATIEETFAGQNLSTDLDTDELYKSVDFMIGFGLGYELPSGLSFNGRFSLGLTNIFDTDVVDPELLELRNALFQLSVGFPVFGN